MFVTPSRRNYWTDVPRTRTYIVDDLCPEKIYDFRTIGVKTWTFRGGSRGQMVW